MMTQPVTPQIGLRLWVVALGLWWSKIGRLWIYLYAEKNVFENITREFIQNMLEKQGTMMIENKKINKITYLL